MASREVKPVFKIVFRAESHPVDATARLKRLLKLSLRSFSFRCVSVEQFRSEGKEETSPQREIEHLEHDRQEQEIIFAHLDRHFSGSKVIDKLRKAAGGP